MKKTAGFAAFTLAAAVFISALPLSANAADKESVHLIVRNDTFSVSDGADWDGVLVDEWVDLEDDSTAAGIFSKAIADKGFTQTGAESGYITEINGLTAEDGGTMGGWSFLLDDWFTDEGISAYTVSSGKLSDGDVICLSYSLAWGADLGYDWQGTDTSLSSLQSDSGELSPAFAADVKEYTLTIPEDNAELNISAAAVNKAFRWKLYKNSYTPDEKNTELKPSRPVSVSDGDKLYIGVGNASWHQYMNEGASETVYTVNVRKNDSQKTDDTEKKDEESDTDTSEPSVEVKSADTDEIVRSVTEKITSDEKFAAAGNEWEIMTLARLGKFSEKDKKAYAQSAAGYLSENELTKATDNARFIIALTAIGKDASDFNGIDLTKPLTDYDYASKQGINGIVYSLIALDTASYQSDDNIRESLISGILSAQLEDGGWTFYGDVYDPDMTGMALQALAPYYEADEKVHNAVDRALELLSAVQNENGTYSSYGAENAESCAQVLTALCSLGIDPGKDSRFIKNGITLPDALAGFYVADGKGFSHTAGGEVNSYSTDQSFYALCAYSRFNEGKTPLYDMSDTEISADENEESVDPTDESSDEAAEEVSDNDEETDNEYQDEDSSDDNNYDENSDSDNKDGNTTTQDNESSDNASGSEGGTFSTGDNSIMTLSLVLLLLVSAGAGLISFRKKNY